MNFLCGYASSRSFTSVTKLFLFKFTKFTLPAFLETCRKLQNSAVSVFQGKNSDKSFLILFQETIVPSIQAASKAASSRSATEHIVQVNEKLHRMSTICSCNFSFKRSFQLFLSFMYINQSGLVWVSSEGITEEKLKIQIYCNRVISSSTELSSLSV